MNTTESPSDSTAFDHSTSDTQTLKAVWDRLAELIKRVGELETELKQKDEHIETLEATVTEQDAILSAIRKKSGNTREMVRELQERELEKNAHLHWENVYPHKEELEITADSVEKFTKDDGKTYARIPSGEDPLDRGGEPALTTGDLLPIQQLARMLHHNKPGVNKEYSQKLAGRTIDALLDLTKDRLYVKRKNRREDGLFYKERRVGFPEESEISGETTFETGPPETADVGSE